MTRTFKLSAIAAAAFIAAPAFAAMTTDANLELDTTNGNKGRGMTQGGRVEFNVAGKAGGDAGFVAGRGTLLITKSGGAGVDDMWGQVGTSMADVKFGKFEAADLFPAGKDVLVDDGAEVTGGYRANRLRGRFGNSAAHGALTINAAPGVGFELGVVETKAVDGIKGVRPVVSFAAGPVTVKLGFESGTANVTSTAVASHKFSGFGATVGGTFGGVGLNVNLASGSDKLVLGTQKSNSFGVNATVGAFGAGYVMDKNKTLATKDTAIYAAYSLPVFNTGATLTPAVSHQTGTAVTAGTSFRVRLNYGF
jgi:Porin-like glycoporin RafY